MKTQGYIRQSYETKGKKFVLLEVESLPAESDDVMAITFGKPGEKRSLDANAYHWVLVNKIARVLNTDSTSVHYQLMLDYGTTLVDEDGVALVAILPSHVDLKAVDGVYGRQLNNDGPLRRYLLIKASRYYNKAEMARLLEGTVYTARLLDIETLTPNELRAMGIK